VPWIIPEVVFTCGGAARRPSGGGRGVNARADVVRHANVRKEECIVIA
jgi:hypothetical protein